MARVLGWARKQARRALRKVEVGECKAPAEFANEWNELYQALRVRHDIQGIRGFSRRSFSQQLAMPGVVVLQAFHQGELVGAQIYFLQGDVVHCHLGAVTATGIGEEIVKMVKLKFN